VGNVGEILQLIWNVPKGQNAVNDTLKGRQVKWTINRFVLCTCVSNRLILCRSVYRRHDCNIVIANILQRYVRMTCGVLQFGREMATVLSSLWPAYPGRYGHQFYVQHRCHMALRVCNHNWLWVLSADGKSYCCWFDYL